MNRSLLSTCLFALCGCATVSEPAAVNVHERVAAFQASNRLAEETQKLLNDAESEMKASEMERAKTALAQARQNLAKPEMALSGQKAALEQRVKADESAMAQMPATAAAPVAAAQPKVDPKRALEAAQLDWMRAKSGLHGHELSQVDVDAARAAREALSRSLEASKGLEKDESFAELAQTGTASVAESDAEIRLAGLIADFVAGPGAAQKKAHALLEKAKTESNSRMRTDAQREARAALEECVARSQKMIAENDVLNRTALFLAKERTSPKKIFAACTAELKALGRKTGKTVAKARGSSRVSG